MKNSINETEYMYACAKIRAMENGLPSKSKLDRLIDASSGDAAVLLKDLGIDLSRGIEEGISARLSSAYGELIKEIPDGDLVRIFMYQYDCNNIKAELKCAHRGIDSEEMLFSCGSVPRDELARAMRESDFSAFPKNMAEAAHGALEALSSTGNPQTVDILLDRACYLDMLGLAQPYERVHGWIKIKIDILNMLICLRLIRMGGYAAPSLLDDMLLDGGDVSKDVFRKALPKGESALWDGLKYGKLAPLAERMAGKGRALSLGDAEKQADDFFMSFVKEAKLVSFGAEIVAAYIIALECALKNVRIILAGKEAELDADTIRAKLRESYV